MADAITWAEPGGARMITRLPECATSTTNSPMTRRRWSSGAERSLACSGIAYAIVPPGMRTLSAPSSSRSRLTVACVATTPSAARSSTSCAWLLTACSSSSRAIRCCRCGLPRVAMSLVPRQRQRGERGAGAVEAVLGLLPDRGLRPVDHGGGHFFAAVGRQAVQESRLWARQLHQAFIDLETDERRSADFGLVLLAHRRPHVGVHDVRALDGLVGFVGDLDRAAEVARRRHDLVVELVPRGPRDGQLEAAPRRC